MAKQRLSVTIESELFEVLDRQVGGRFPTRSAAAEEAIRALLRENQDKLISDFYANQSDNDQQDEASWSEAGARLFMSEE